MPLSDGDADVQLDLQSLFGEVYDRAGYDYSLHYHRPIRPALSSSEIAWVKEILTSRR